VWERSFFLCRTTCGQRQHRAKICADPEFGSAGVPLSGMGRTFALMGDKEN